MIATVEKISEYFLTPALEQILELFPFKIISFHSDNGSVYINKNVAELLEKLLIEFTQHLIRPRPRLMVPTFGKVEDSRGDNYLPSTLYFNARCWVPKSLVF